ncbi:probable serine/threonine protein kinase IREH1 isoform X2 [Solanum dulcamara]|uniref:probable serine/threonine protein kinase IREH1 isoform X2 n=1 Tax=Solanum dulcamara TaxID=45834 RepID=UPI002485650B|nr:probable serine/threonine protein kinase IREH1 isoform X2 [Solanum dulcamara]
MVFKGRFFSSKKSDTSSPDGSYNSPRSSGSNSPILSDSKKKGKSTSKDNSPSTPTSLSSFASFRDKKKNAKGKESQNSTPIKNLEKPNSVEVKEKKGVTETKEAGATSFPLSPIMASSLGLNKIKTRSGPLPQESFFGYGSRDKGNALGASNLSKTDGDRPLLSGWGKKSSGKKDEKKSVLGSTENSSNSDGLSAVSAGLRDRSTHIPGPSRLQSGESSSGAGQFNPSWSHSGGLRGMDVYTPELKTSYEWENPKESESPRVQAILRVTSAPRKRFPADIKSFSHELNSKGVRPYPFWKPRGLNNLEEVLTMIRAKFDKAKEEVDSDLRIFAADLVGVLEKNAEIHPEWQETIEDLLVLARSCAMTSPGEFWLQCEGIVQELDDRRQELPMGTLKQLHTRMLFILTRCTRLLQFHKESAFAEDEPVFPLRQSLQPVEKHTPPRMGRNVMMSGPMQFPKVPAPRKSYSQEQHGLEWKRDQAVHQGDSHVAQAENPKKLESPGGGDRMTSWKKFPTPAVKSPKEASPTKEDTIDGNIEPSKLVMNKREIPDANVAAAKHPEHQHKVSWGYWGDQPSVSDENSIICRICEDEVPTLHVEDHSRICAIADRCDQKGLSVNERLLRIADTLEKLMESFSQKDFQPIVGSPDVTKVSNSSVTEESEPLSPKLSDWSRRGSEDMLDCFPEADNSVFMDEFKGLHTMSCKTRFGPKSDQGLTTSSAGSMTPRSPLQSPRTSPIDLLLAGKGGFSEHDDLPQMIEQADIARCVANTPLNDDRSISYLLSCLEDLKVVTERRKRDALTVETFGTRIEKLIREKYLQLCELVDDDKVDISSTVIDEDAPLEDDVVRSLRTSPIHSKDRTSIDDFEIIKPISRGAFGRVFLAKKKATGDFFAIKVLKKADMIRKNAVESILAERDILISVRNPFVVRFFYSFTCRENLYLVMEYLNGGDLYSLLRNLGCLDEDVARVYIAEVVLALEYLHSLRVVHRDLKPDNLLIAHDGHIKLTDFGLSKVGLINSTDDLSGPAVSGASMMEDDESQLLAPEHQRERREKRSAVGTPDYLAPEILLGTGHGFTADWWSVGVILFELIVGIPPFNAEHPQKIFDNILNRNIPWPGVPEEMSPEAYDLIDRLLIEDPNQRLGAGGASEVKQHPFFRDINWDTLARQKKMHRIQVTS